MLLCFFLEFFHFLVFIIGSAFDSQSTRKTCRGKFLLLGENGLEHADVIFLLLQEFCLCEPGIGYRLHTFISTGMLDVELL